MRESKMLKLLTAAFFAICVTMSCLSINVSAASVYGSKKTVSVYGKSYTYYSSAHNNSTSSWAYGSVDSNSSNVPAGYFGINSRLYNSSGSLIKSSGMVYNTTSASSTSRSSGSTTTKGTYYGQAQVKFYNGNGYNTYTSNASPRVQRSSVPMILEEPYEVNDNGLTYGSGFYAESLEESPDLMKVIGENGVEGYVYSKDINLELNTLDEVLDYINSGQLDYVVPVYEKDGITTVDTFEITTED